MPCMARLGMGRKSYVQLPCATRKGVAGWMRATGKPRLGKRGQPSTRQWPGDTRQGMRWLLRAGEAGVRQQHDCMPTARGRLHAQDACTRAPGKQDGSHRPRKLRAPRALHGTPDQVRARSKASMTMVSRRLHAIRTAGQQLRPAHSPTPTAHLPHCKRSSCQASHQGES